MLRPDEFSQQFKKPLNTDFLTELGKKIRIRNRQDFSKEINF